MIESVSSWFTPTVVFCVLNLMIATILILRNTCKQQGESPSLLQRVRSVNLSFPDPFNSPLTTHFPADNMMSPPLLQRVNFSFSSQKPTPFPSLDQDEQPPGENAEDVDSKCHMKRSKSPFGDDAVDKKADDFINKFKEQLKMQRIHSILNSRKSGVSI